MLRVQGTLGNPAFPADWNTRVRTPPPPPDSPGSPYRPAPLECRPDLNPQPEWRTPWPQRSPGRKVPETRTDWKKSSLAETRPVSPCRDEYIPENGSARSDSGLTIAPNP